LGLWGGLGGATGLQSGGMAERDEIARSGSFPAAGATEWLT
jgi:hypothetical protein